MPAPNSPPHAFMTSPAPGAAAAAAGAAGCGAGPYVALTKDQQYNQLAMACQQGVSLQGSPLPGMPVVPILPSPCSTMMIRPSGPGLPTFGVPGPVGGYGAGLAAASGRSMPGSQPPAAVAAAAAAAGGTSSAAGGTSSGQVSSMNALGVSAGTGQVLCICCTMYRTAMSSRHACVHMYTNRWALL
jgi:hypothetical protein